MGEGESESERESESESESESKWKSESQSESQIERQANLRPRVLGISRIASAQPGRADKHLRSSCRPEGTSGRVASVSVLRPVCAAAR